MIARKEYTLDRVVRLLISIVLIGASIYFINYIKVALLPFLVAWLLAYFINPVVEFVRVKMKFGNKLLSIITVLAMLIVTLSLIVVATLPSIREEFSVVVRSVNQYLADGSVSESIPEWLRDYMRENLTFKDIMAELKSYNLTEIINRVVAWLWSIATGSLDLVFAIVGVLAVILYMIFILIDFDNISQGSVKLIPHKYRKGVSLILDDVSLSMNRYFRGQALVALCVGLLLAVGFTIIGMPLGFAFGLFVGLLNMVPYLQLIGIVPMAFLCVVMSIEGGGDFWVNFGLSLMVMVVVQIIQDTLIVPKIMGKITGLNPAVILLSLSIWGVLLGVIGMIIALPMTTLLLSYYKRFVIEGGHIEDDQPLNVEGNFTKLPLKGGDLPQQ